MNSISTNFHTHTYLCKHAEGKPLDYARLAYRLGYDEIGFTDHGPLISEIYNNLVTRRMDFKQYRNIYLPDLLEAKKVYKDQIKVYSGLEIEYFDQMKDVYPKFLKDLDYLLLGQHYFLSQNKYCSVYNKLTDEQIVDYTNHVIKGIETGCFKILAHPEIFAWQRKWDEHCEKQATAIILAAVKNNVVLEINANGIRNSLRHKKVYDFNGQKSYAYPRYEFWLLVKKLNAKVIVNDDAHYFCNLHDSFTEEAYEMARNLGLNLVRTIF